MRVPLEVIGQRGSSRQKLFKRGRVFFVLYFLGLIPRVEVVLKLTIYKKALMTLFIGVGYHRGV